MPEGAVIRMEVSAGELLDKIAILQIKSERMTGPRKLANVRTELDTLTSARDSAMQPSPQLNALTRDLKTLNEALWDIEDGIRVCERDGDFGPRFVELARSVYRQNDRRAAIKREINELRGSRLVEEKEYTGY
jgi:Family of unknown function (DUF6165)